MINNARKIISALLVAAVLCTTFIVGVSAAGKPVSYSPSSAYASSEFYGALCEVRLTGDQALDVANVAKSQVGYHESSNGDLSGYGSGEGNYTEYGRWYGMQSDWCNMFAFWCGSVAGVPSSIFPKLTSATASYQSIMASVGAERFAFSSGRELETGDLIFSCTCGAGGSCIDHIGIVVDVDSTTIYTVEGNMSHQVKACTYPASSGYQSKLDAQINFVARPSYEVSAESQKPDTENIVSVADGNKFYTLYNSSVSYDVAKEFCESVGGKLADYDEKSAKALEKLASKGSLDRYFVESEDYTYTALTEDGVTGVTASRRFTGFVCEKSTQSIKPATTAAFNGSKYEIYDAELSYKEAKAFAQSMGGRLAVLDGKNEEKLVSILLKDADEYFIGNIQKKKSGAVNTLKHPTEKKAENTATEKDKTVMGFVVEYSKDTTHTVIFDANGGEAAPLEKVTKRGNYFKISDITPTKSNREFLGWSTDKKAKEPTYTVGDTFRLNSDVVLYAVWG